jgi:hypothetical protein
MTPKVLGEANKNSRIDSRRESYRPFYDCQWHCELDETTKRFPDLARIFLDLAMSWRGASNTQYLPAHTVHLLEIFANNHDPYGKEFQEEFIARLMCRIGNDLSNMKRKQVRNAAGDVFDEIRQEMANVVLDGGTFWNNDFVANQEIRLAIIGTQRMCYAAIYYAYENFVLQIYQLVSASPNYRIRDAKSFSKDFAGTFGAGLRTFCWSAPAIRIAGLVRNALVHNGGRMTDQLRNEEHDFEVVDGEIQVLPGHTKALHDLLKERVPRLVNETIAKLSERA